MRQTNKWKVCATRTTPKWMFLFWKMILMSFVLKLKLKWGRETFMHILLLFVVSAVSARQNKSPFRGGDSCFGQLQIQLPCLHHHHQQHHEATRYSPLPACLLACLLFVVIYLLPISPPSHGCHRNDIMYVHTFSITTNCYKHKIYYTTFYHSKNCKQHYSHM